MKPKPSKTREELSALILSKLARFPDCGTISGVVIAPVLKPDGSLPNWHAAFTTQGKQRVPGIAWQVGSEVADEFDLA